MSFFGKFNSESLKNAALAAKNKLEASANELGAKATEIASNTSVALQTFDYEATKEALTDKAKKISESASDLAKTSVETVKNIDYSDVKASATEKLTRLGSDLTEMKDKAAEAIEQFDFDAAKESASTTARESISKVNQYFVSTFELDKSTFEVVRDIRGKLPTPANTIDEIFQQCRDEALRRAIAAFMLGDILDQKSQAKYDKLTDSYDVYRKTRQDSFGNYGHAKPDKDTPDGTVFRNDYNPDDPLVYERSRGTNVSVDHFTSRKEIFSSLLLKIGLTDEQLGEVVNNPGNLKFMHRSLNSQKNDMDVYEWLDKHSRPHPTEEGKLIVTVGKDKTEHVIDKKAVDEMYAESKSVIRQGQIQAVKEIGATMAITGATMAAQQIVGLIVVETIDVFMDELRRIKLVSNAGIIEEMKSSRDRISEALNKRFEERQIWSRAKSIGLEAGVSGALSVIPQILISLIVKIPSFAYAIIRESTLSVVRAVRVLSSDEPDKLSALQVILMGATSAVAGIYVQRVISQGIAGVPMLNQFNTQVSAVLSGLMITGIPLAAIYTFDQNKATLVLKLKEITSSS